MTSGCRCHSFLPLHVTIEGKDRLLQGRESIRLSGQNGHVHTRARPARLLIVDDFLSSGSAYIRQNQQAHARSEMGHLNSTRAQGQNAGHHITIKK
ncbi:hypothetical protein GM557_06155 [Bombella sp. ESL0385]|nr:hypothetical protein [Bombella sp. ESL0385]